MDDRSVALFPIEETEQSIASRFERQVELHPEHVALSGGERDYTYRELNRISNRIARMLRREVQNESTRVVIYLDKGPTYIAAILGVLKAGHAYVPIDPAFPHARNRFILEDSSAEVVLTEGVHAGAVSALASTTARVIDLSALFAAASLPDDEANLGLAISPDALAYIIYTSGSTGQPKGVMQNHRNTLHGCMRRTNLQRVAADDRMSLFYSCSVMGSVYCIFGALLNGAALLPYDIREEGLLDLARWLVEQQVTIYHSVASVFRSFAATVEGPIVGNRVRLVIFGGERVLASDVAAARRVFSRSVAFFTGLGSTETGTVRHYLIGPQSVEPSRIVPIGYPVEGVDIVLTDEDGRTVPPGEIGEINVHSRYLALGYWNNPEATRKLFTAVPGEPGVRGYRMGDMAELHADGLLEHRGRRDFQVKIRGFRVEIGEVESALIGHPALVEGVVKAAEIGDETQLVAYVVLKPGQANETPLTVRQLMEFLRGKLPSYMVPTVYVSLDRVPKTPNGKVDKNALPAPHPSNELPEEARVPPSTETERRLCELCAVLLRRDEVGANENFFDLGGDSLSATQLIARIQEVFGVRLPMRSVFSARDFRALARAIGSPEQGAIKASETTVVATGRPARVPATPAQRRMWLIAQMFRGQSVYHISNAVFLRGQLDVSALERSLNDIVMRHEILRTVFPADDDGCWQHVLPYAPFSLPQADCGRLSPEQARREALDVVRQQLNQPQDLAKGPLWRCALIKISECEHVLSLVFNHIIYDNIWSSRIFFSELGSLYRWYQAGAAGSSPLAQSALQFADYALWEDRRVREGGLEEHLEYFRKELEAPPSPPQIPSDRPRSARPSFAGGQVSFVIPAHLRVALSYFGRGESATLFMTLLAAWQLLLARYSGQDDILVGTPTGRRYRPETEDLIGLFINNLVLRARISPTMGFRQLLGEVRRVCVDAFSHDELPFEELVAQLRPARTTGVSPFFQHFFIHRNATRAAWEIPGLEVEPIRVHAGSSKFDLTLSVLETEHQLSATLEYSADLFDRETVVRMADNYVQLLGSAVESPDRCVWELALVSGTERALSLRAWNETAADYPSETCTHQLIAAVAAVRPGSLAVIGERESLTYRELDERTRVLAERLRDLGVRVGDLVAVCLNRSPDLVVALLAVMKSGAAYVPLDPDFPPERLSYMIEDSAAAVFISEASIAARVPAGAARVLLLDVAPDASRPPRGDAAQSPLEPSPAACPADLAYVIYTSGSTGQPKGVQVTHRGLLNLLLAMQAEPGMTSDDVMQALTTVCFDIAALELFLPLVVGARLVISGRETSLSPQKLKQSLLEHRVSVMQATPITWRMLLESGWSGSPGFKVLCGGEGMGLDLAEQLLSTGCEIWNLYGPTETTIWSTAGRVVEKQDASFVGKPLANTQLYVVNPHLALQPIGVPGELLIGGDGVARGYWRRAELTQERFVQSPWAGGKMLFRTGDLVIRRADGALAFLGRIDNQVKIRGFRIELGEIEAQIAAHPSVKQAVVIAREDVPGDKRLVAYCIASDPSARGDFRGLQEHLKQKLPYYMVPSAVVYVEAFPQTPNGKIDRKRLPAPSFAAASTTVDSEGSGPRHDLDRGLLFLWETALGRQGISIDDDFFALGGDSMLAIRVLQDMQRSLELNVPLSTLFEASTIRALVDRAGEREHQQAATIVKLNHVGTGMPTYCLAGVAPYKPLAARMTTSPVFAVYTLAELESIDAQKAGVRQKSATDALVNTYVDAIVRHVRGEKLALVGYSFGGLMALEVAHRLRRRGYAVDDVILLDAIPRSAYVRTVGNAVRNLAAGNAQAQAVPVVRQLAQRAYRRLAEEVQLVGGRGGAARTRRDAVARAHAFRGLKGAFDLHKKTYDFDVLLIKAAKKHLLMGRKLKVDHDLRSAIRGRLRVVEVHSDHLDMLRGQAAEEVFAIVSRYMSDRQGG